jgi:Na+-transporting methylmalonyl-CoA/oxaloacetate decarboxylase gamma subunit
MLAGSFFDVLARLIRIASLIAVAFIVAGLIGLLTDEVRDTSKVQSTRIQDPGTGQQVTKTVDIEAPKPSAAIEQVREDEHTKGREVIDDVGDVLMGPFTWIMKGSDGAVRKLLYSALALILYGFLIQMLADFMRREADAQRRADKAAQEAAAAEERRKSGQFISPA